MDLEKLDVNSEVIPPEEWSKIQEIIKKEEEEERLYVSMPKEKHSEVIKRAHYLGIEEIFNIANDEEMLSFLSGQPTQVSLFLQETGLSRKTDILRFQPM